MKLTNILSEMQTFERYADSKLDGSSPLKSTGHGSHGFQKTFPILFHLTIKQFSIFTSDHFR